MQLKMMELISKPQAKIEIQKFLTEKIHVYREELRPPRHDLANLLEEKCNKAFKGTDMEFAPSKKRSLR